MKIILKQRVEKLGQTGDLVNVKDGFARNFLFPRNLALAASAANLKVVEMLKASKSAQEEKEKQKALELAQKLEKASFTLSVEATADDKLYGGIDVSEIAALLKNEGCDTDKKNVLLDEPIKSLGVFPVEVKLHPQVSAKIKVWIVRK